MSLTPKSKYIGWLGISLRETRVKAMDSPGTRTRPWALWALIALLPISFGFWIEVFRRHPATSINTEFATGPEQAARVVLPLKPEAQPVTQGSSPAVGAQTPEPSAAAPESGAMRCHVLEPKPEEAVAPEPRPETTTTPVEVAESASLAEEIALGRALFDRRWVPGDSRCHGGDGLGPVFNASSCLDCHRDGGPGGGGPVRTNAQLVTVIGHAVPKPKTTRLIPNGNGALYQVRPFPGGRISGAAQAQLVKLHPGFADAPGIVLHRFGVAPGYDRWRQRFSIELARHAMEIASPRKVFQGALIDGLTEQVALHLTERNPTPLFGSGQIDSLSDQTLLEKASKEAAGVQGRVPRSKDGKIGRFGWKGQTETLRDFVLSACANELGLEVPGHHQGASPLAQGVASKGLDMTAKECDALVAYVRNLSAPIAVEPTRPSGALQAEIGRQIFDEIGCAGCHSPNLGSVMGIYSDLLLHDMGEELADPGVYYGNSQSRDSARSTEWRTPPLWGVRDSGPYLHDGRAHTLEDVVSLHGGQGRPSAMRFETLTQEERFELKVFLNSLTAPAPDKLADDAAQENEVGQTKRDPRHSRTPRRGSPVVRPVSGENLDG
jgi:CxxC motif-containing protein (DUF1111 family)